MTSPPRPITVQCPRCGHRFEDWYRASINLDLDDFDDDYVREATSATCPTCALVIDLGAIVVQGDVWTIGVESV